MSDVDDQRLHAIVHLQFVFSHAQRKPVGQAQCLVRGRAGRDEAGQDVEVVWSDIEAAEQGLL